MSISVIHKQLINEELHNDIQMACDMLGIAEAFSKARAVFIKPNLTYPVFKKGVTTQQEFINAIIAVLRRINEHTMIYVGESEGGYNGFSMEDALRNMGYYDLEKKYSNVLVVNLTRMSSREAELDTLRGPYKVLLPELLLDEIDFSISCPVPKVHCMTTVSLAYKNIWGCLPDVMRLKNHYMFDYIISRIAEVLKFKYVFLDGKYGLDRYGPMGGGSEPVELGWFAASNSLGAHDRIITEIMGFRWKSIRHLKIAERYGYIPSDREIEMTGNKNVSHKFTLKRSLWNIPALIAFRSKWLTDVFYMSPFAKPLHTLMYLVRKKPIDDDK